MLHKYSTSMSPQLFEDISFKPDHIDVYEYSKGKEKDETFLVNLILEIFVCLNFLSALPFLLTVLLKISILKGFGELER